MWRRMIEDREAISQTVSATEDTDATITLIGADIGRRSTDIQNYDTAS